jgi:hypothetical protein
LSHGSVRWKALLGKKEHEVILGVISGVAADIQARFQSVVKKGFPESEKCEDCYDGTCQYAGKSLNIPSRHTLGSLQRQMLVVVMATLFVLARGGSTQSTNLSTFYLDVF